MDTDLPTPLGLDGDEHKLLVSYVLSLRKDFVQDLLAALDVPRSGIKADLRDRLHGALGAAPPERIAQTIRFLDAREPWGKQQVELLEGPAAILREFTSTDALRARLGQAGLLSLLDEPPVLALPRELTLSQVVVGDGAVDIRAVERRDYFERTPEYDYEAPAADGTLVRYRAQTHRVARGVLQLRVRPRDRRVTLHISQGERSYDYAEARRRFVALLAPVLDIGRLETIDLRPAVFALHELESAARGAGRNPLTRGHRVAVRLTSGVMVAITSPSADTEMAGDPVVEDTVSRTRRAGTGSLGNVYFLPQDGTDNPLTMEVHVILAAAESRVQIRNPTSEAVVEHIVDAIRGLSNMAGALRPVAEALAARLDMLASPSRLAVPELASQTGKDPADVETVLRDFEQAGLLVADEHVVCRCGTAMRLSTLRAQLDNEGEASCTACDRPISPERPAFVQWELSGTTLDAIRRRLTNPCTATILCALDLERAAFRRTSPVGAGRPALTAAIWSAISPGRTHSGRSRSASLAPRCRPRPHSRRPRLPPTGPMSPSLPASRIRRDVARGDVAVGDVVADVSDGKERGDQTDYESDPYRASAKAVDAARQVLTQEHWVQRIAIASPDASTPKAVIGPIAVSNRVIASDEGEMSEAARRLLRRAIAVEMEGAGFLAALHRTGDVEAIVVRGISDARADKTPGEDEMWQPAAADHAAAFACEFLAVW